jgi:hypothetical protein
MRYGTGIGLAVALLLSPATHASGINGINGGMPNRLSMNVTVPKQTQGATFGEKVNAGLQAAGSAVAQGASLSIVVECGQAACAVVFPDGAGVRADMTRMTVQPLEASQSTALRGGTALGQGASLLGGALPGGAIVSAAVSSVGKLAGGAGGAASASYAATGRMAPAASATSSLGTAAKPGGAAAASYARAASEEAPAPLRSTRSGDGRIDVLDALADGDYALALVVEKATSGLKDTLKTQVRVAAPQRVEIVVRFSVEAGVLKARHEMAMNSIRNLR